jgi:hypothetical protein
MARRTPKIAQTMVLNSVPSEKNKKEIKNKSEKI